MTDGRNGVSDAAAQAGFLVFTSVDKFKGYVTHEVLAM
jgi:hypothetical protein